MFTLLLAMTFAADPDPTPRFKAKLRRDDDRFEAKMEKGVPVWIIYNPKGISSAEVKLESGLAPKKIVFRFPAFRNMASFHVIQDGKSYGGTVGRSQPKLEYFFDEKGGKVKKAEEAAVTLTGQAMPKGGIEFTFENKKPGKAWRLDWIDDYRR
jgi:hypothetical protein